MMNEQYAVAMVEVKDIVVENAASDRLALIFDLIDFDQFKTICDIGSRFLEQTIEMSYIFPKAKLHAFEPVPSSYNICLDNRAKLCTEQKERISIYNLALNDQTGIIDFFEVDDTGSEHNVGASSKYQFVPGLNGSFFNKTWNQRKIQVQSMTMDQWRRDNNIDPVDLLWMDVQGAELDVLKGAEQTLKDVKVIMTEAGTSSYYQGQSLLPEIDAYLQSQGFRMLDGSFRRNHDYEGDIIYIRS